MVDGDQLNVVTDPVFIEVAERNAREFDFAPLYYDAGTADAEIITFESMFNGLKRAHDFSSGGITSIGEISNMLCRIWNKDHPDRHAANLLSYFNNLVNAMAHLYGDIQLNSELRGTSKLVHSERSVT